MMDLQEIEILYIYTKQAKEIQILSISLIIMVRLDCEKHMCYEDDIKDMQWPETLSGIKETTMCTEK